MLRDQILDLLPRCVPAAERAGIVALALAIGLLVGVVDARADTDEPKLLLLPFVVHSAEDPAYVRGGLADMLYARFARIGGLELIAEAEEDKGTSSLDVALAAAREAGADYVLFGSFTRFGKGASLDVQCAPAGDGPSQEPLREIFVHSGSIGEIIPDLDELAGKVTRFAHGEILSGPPVVGAVGVVGGGTASSAPGPDLSELTERISALEESVTQLLEAGDAAESVGAAETAP